MKGQLYNTEDIGDRNIAFLSLFGVSLFFTSLARLNAPFRGCQSMQVTLL